MKVLAILVLAALTSLGGDLGQLRKELRRAEGAERKIALLEEVARLGKSTTDSSDGETRQGAANLLSLAMWDEVPEVRVRAIELLADGQDREIAASSFLKRTKEAASDYERSIRKMKKYIEESAGEFATAVDAVEDLEAGDKSKQRKAEREVARSKRKMRSLGEKGEQLLNESEGLEATIEGLIAAFTNFPDDRAVEGLARIVEMDIANEAEVSHSKAAQALLQHGTADALKGVLDLWPAYEKQCRASKRALEEARREKPRRLPKSLAREGYDKSRWESFERDRLRKKVESLEQGIVHRTELAEALRHELLLFARKRRLATIPDECLPVKPWKSWFSKVKGDLPSSVASAKETPNPSAGK